jgi:hypothetical protein
MRALKVQNSTILIPELLQSNKIRYKFNILLNLKTKNVFLHQIKNNDTRFKHSLEPIRRY